MRGKGFRSLVLVGALVVSAAGCWPQPSADPGGTNHNPFESALTADNVASLEDVWSRPGVTAATTGDKVVVASYDRPGLPTNGTVHVAVVDAATGAPRWVWITWSDFACTGTLCTHRPASQRLDLATGQPLGPIPATGWIEAIRPAARG